MINENTAPCLWCSGSRQHQRPSSRTKFCSQKCYKAAGGSRYKSRIELLRLGPLPKKPRLQVQADSRQKHREELRMKGRKYYHQHASCLKDRNLRKRYGITLEDYDRMVVEQGNTCAICHKPEVAIPCNINKLRPLSVDHNHKTGKVRALLCGHCNAVLAKVEDLPQLIEDMKAYLIKWW